jgi:hypothetical protein
MEGVLRNLQNVIVYIDDLLIHSDTHETTPPDLGTSTPEAATKSLENQPGKMHIWK